MTLLILRSLEFNDDMMNVSERETQLHLYDKHRHFSKDAKIRADTMTEGSYVISVQYIIHLIRCTQLPSQECLTGCLINGELVRNPIS
jgi:hypothetical protein